MTLCHHLRRRSIWCEHTKVCRLYCRLSLNALSLSSYNCELLALTNALYSQLIPPIVGFPPHLLVRDARLRLRPPRWAEEGVECARFGVGQGDERYAFVVVKGVPLAGHSFSSPCTARSTASSGVVFVWHCSSAADMGKSRFPHCTHRPMKRSPFGLVRSREWVMLHSFVARGSQNCTL